LNEIIESIFIFQFIDIIIINIIENNHEYNIIFAKRISFIEDNFVYSWEKYIFKIQDNKKNIFLIWIIDIWVYNKSKIILYNEILKFQSLVIEKIWGDNLEILYIYFIKRIKLIQINQEFKIIKIIERIELIKIVKRIE